MHSDLRLAGALPPLDAPHHMRATEWAMYREGVVVSSVLGEGSLLNVGLDKVKPYIPVFHQIKDLIFVLSLQCCIHQCSHNIPSPICH